MATQDPTPIEMRYRAMNRLAVAAARGEAPQRLLENALGHAVDNVGLMAGAVRIFGTGDADLAGAVAGEENGQRRMLELEETLLSQLRRNWAVRSLFMTLDLDGPCGLFSYPLRSGEIVLGAISGIARGERNLASEEEFVGGLAAMIVLVGRTGASWSVAGTETAATRDSQIKTQAVLEAGAALNHEINNPLMAVLGNVELLMRKTQGLDADTTAKLGKIHEAAERIRKVTQALMRITEARSVQYPGGGTMIDIEGSPKSGEGT